MSPEQEARALIDRQLDQAGWLVQDRPGMNLYARRGVAVREFPRKTGDVRDLHGAVDRDGAAIGVFITLEPPMDPMQTDGVSAGYYHSAGWNRDYPHIQLITIDDLLRGKKIEMPPEHGTFKQAPRAEQAGQQHELGL